jgi:hypothetical protein
MSDLPNDLERRLTEALTEGAQDAPSVIGLAAAARSRARERRRTRIATGAALVALAIGVPSAAVALRTDHGRDGDGTTERGNSAVDPGSSESTATDPGSHWPSGGGYRWESWHGVSVRVPKNWGYGDLGSWCAGGGSLDTPLVSRPGGATEGIGCTPASGYGLSFQEIDNRDDFSWPVTHQDGGGWPEDNEVGGRGIGGVLVMVATPDGDQARFILDSMRAIGRAGDANGCQARYTPDSENPPEGAISVCRYDENGALEQSEALVGEDAGKAVQALQAAPDPGDCPDNSQGSQPHQIVILESAGISARVDLVDGCPRVTVDGQLRELTPDVLYWALSPGWSGSVPAGVSLPSELRTE